MAAGDKRFGGKIVLDGAAEYRAALNEITASQRTLNKEMKLAESEFKKTGDAQQLYNEKIRLLNAQMDNQKKKLETAQKALKELSDKGVDKNSDLWRKWNEILLDSQTKMNTLQAELNTTTAAMKDNADATEQVTQATERATQETADYSETLKSIDKGVKFQNVLKGLGLIKDAVGGVISTAYRMGKALVMSQISGGDWAREIMMGAAKAGVSVEEYQARLYAQAVGGINTDAITEGVKKTTENLATTDAELLKLYNDLGISTRNADNTVRDATETFWASVDALKGIEDQTTRSIYAQKLLGDQYLELRGLVDLGSEGYEKLIAEGKASATVTEESVNALADMDAAVEKVNATTETLKHTVQSQLAPGFTEMAEAFGSILQDFNDFITSEEGKNIIAGWNEDLTSLAGTIKDTDFTGAFETIGSALKGIRETIEWMVDNYNDIRNVFGIVAPLLTDHPLLASAKIEASVAERASELWGNEASASKPSLPAAFAQPAMSTELKNQLAALKDYLIAAQEGYGEDNYTAIAQAFKGAMTAPGNDVFINQAAKEAMQAVIDAISESGAASYSLYAEAIAKFRESLNSELPETAEAGGGGAMNAFNAAIEKGTQDTQKTLKTGVAAAFSGFDSLFASMGTAHGAAYINALSAQMARINNMLSLYPSYYGSGAYASAQSAYASPTSATNFRASIYLGKERFGEIATPIVNADMGADLVTLR